MANSTVSYDLLLDRAAEVFRAYGFAGASLSRLAHGIGLEKASLYYRFPGGKSQIALEVVRRVARWLDEFVIAPLHRDGRPADLLQEVLTKLEQFYAGGTKSCGFDVLSIEGAGEELSHPLQQALAAWIDAFVFIAGRAGLPRALAMARGEEAVLQIEGALILSRVRRNPQVFLTILQRIPKLLTEL